MPREKGRGRLGAEDVVWRLVVVFISIGMAGRGARKYGGKGSRKKSRTARGRGNGAVPKGAMPASIVYQEKHSEGRKREGFRKS